jgi:hypothetical protein
MYARFNKAKRTIECKGTMHALPKGERIMYHKKENNSASLRKINNTHYKVVQLIKILNYKQHNSKSIRDLLFAARVMPHIFADVKRRDAEFQRVATGLQQFDQNVEQFMIAFVETTRVLSPELGAFMYRAPLQSART